MILRPTLSNTVRRSSLIALALLLFASPAPAQSGRTRPQPTPTPERPRRVPAQSDQPGQPATPDAPSTTVARPTASPRPAAGQQSPQNPDEAPAEIDEDEVYHVHSNLVPVSANVSDAAGRAVTDLKLEDFELRVDGQPKPISDISFAETPVRLALLFDNSSSVRQARELEKQAAIRFLRTVLRSGVDQAALFSISTYPSLDHPLTGDLAKLARTIEHYGEVEGSTALFDTVIAAAEYLRPMPGRKVIVIVSDGVETTSRITDFGEVIRRALAADCQVFVIQTGLSDNANLRDLLAERRMQDLTASTGGAVYLTRGAADLDPAFAHIAADLSQQYVLSYYPTDDGSDGRFRAISLRIKTRPNMRVRARRGFYPRRRTEASALPANFVLDVAVIAEPEPARPQPDNDAPAAGQRQEVAAVAARSTLHGSKNLSPDADAAADSRAPTDTRPAFRPGNSGPPAAATPDPPRARAETTSQATAAATSAPAERDSAKDSAVTGTDGTTESRDGAKSAPPGTTERAEPSASPSPSTRQPSSEPTPSSSKPAAPSPSQTATQIARQSNPQPADAKAAKPPVSGDVLNGRAVSLPRPSYPESARRMRVAGTVSVEVTIDVDGKVISARAISGPVMLRDAAADAARRARFSPSLISGKPVQVSGVINYNFSL
ncbi:MAG TPA: VWA domain-containing protein [Pyrinomonadaceae bacterium]|nr:VWA domain-containing protein [Pyrinomonadaceae bacterium]